MPENANMNIDEILPEILNNAAKSRAVNSVIPISGERYELPLEGRTIGMAYYRAEQNNAPLVIGFHGGGFLFGGHCLDDALWVQVSKSLGVNIASIDYRMSPEVKDYDCLYDAYDSAVYLVQHAEEYGFDPAHVSAFGCSAGGNLSAAVALLAGQRKNLKLDNQILMYPFLDGASDPDAKGAGSFTGLMPHIMNMLHFTPEKAADPLLSPCYAPQEMLMGLPKAIVVCCENDNLRQEGEQYCRKLRNAGVIVAQTLAEGMPHGFIESGFKKELTPVDREMLGANGEELITSGALHKASEDALAFVNREMVR